MATATVVDFLVAFLSGIAGSSLRHMGVHVERTALARIGVEIMVGFMASVVFLMVMSRSPWDPLYTAMAVGFAFGYLMSSGTVFHRLK